MNLLTTKFFKSWNEKQPIDLNDYKIKYLGGPKWPELTEYQKRILLRKEKEYSAIINL